MCVKKLSLLIRKYLTSRVSQQIFCDQMYLVKLLKISFLLFLEIAFFKSFHCARFVHKIIDRALTIVDVKLPPFFILVALTLLSQIIGGVVSIQWSSRLLSRNIL